MERLTDFIPKLICSSSCCTRQPIKLTNSTQASTVNSLIKREEGHVRQLDSWWWEDFLCGHWCSWWSWPSSPSPAQRRGGSAATCGRRPSPATVWRRSLSGKCTCSGWGRGPPAAPTAQTVAAQVRDWSSSRFEGPWRKGMFVHFGGTRLDVSL